MRKLTLESLRQIAKGKGGKCLSDVYINCYEPMKWECKFGHVWETKATNIQRGSWCHRCYRVENGRSRQKYTIALARQYAESQQGFCLSSAVQSGHEILQWKCKHGHVWTAKFCDILRTRGGNQQKSWCPRCAIDNRTHTLEEIQAIASERNGRCLSAEYNGCEEHLEWECRDGHRWKASLNNIKNNMSWCPECSTSLGEQEFRKALERVLGKSVPKRRPRWLIDENGSRLELDGYNEELQIAFEFQGRQHFKYISYMHKTKQRFLQIQHRDRIKVKLCKEKGIRLLTPSSEIPIREFESFIQTSLRDKQ